MLHFFGIAAPRKLLARQHLNVASDTIAQAARENAEYLYTARLPSSSTRRTTTLQDAQLDNLLPGGGVFSQWIKRFSPGWGRVPWPSAQ